MMPDNMADRPSTKKQEDWGGNRHQSFVRKLYDLLQKPDIEESAPRSIWWTSDGQGICVSPKGFDEHESKKYFQGTRYFGFSRRLMRNYFDRTNSSENLGVHEYRHRDGMFQKDRPDLLQNIKFNNKRPFRKDAEQKSPPSKSSPQSKASSPQQEASKVEATVSHATNTAALVISPAAETVPHPYPSLSALQAGSNLVPRQFPLQMVNQTVALSQSSFLQHQAMQQAQEERRRLLDVLESQRSLENAGQSLDQFVMYQLLREEAQQQRQRQLQNSLFPISPQLSATMSRNVHSTIPMNLAPLTQAASQVGPPIENEALAHYIRELLRLRQGGL